MSPDAETLRAELKKFMAENFSTHSPVCSKCFSTHPSCFCGAPRSEELYHKRMRWANITHPASDDLKLRLERALAEPQTWQEFAKQLERENGELQQKLLAMKSLVK